MSRERRTPKRAPRVRVKPKRRRAGKKSATWLTLSAIMLFEFSACLLLMFRGETIDLTVLLLALALPALAWASVYIVGRVVRADALLVMLMSFLCGLGVILLYTLSPDRALRQLTMYGIGLGAFVLCALSVRVIRDFRLLCFAMIPVGLALLLLPAAIGKETYGARNWIEVPFIGSFQPSEVVKLLLLLTLAQVFGSARSIWGMMPALVFAVACLGALMLQKDLGTALMYYMVTLLMFWASSSNLPLTLLGGVGGVGAAYLGYSMFAHVKTRVAIWINPWSDAMGKGYQIVQGLTAIASGGMLGLGLGMGKGQVIPAHTTDFIFAVLCEQMGIVFGICVLAMYVIIVLRGISLSLHARAPFHALLALGTALLLGVQTFVIIGGVVKLIPLTGITLPFISYGGTSLIASMGMVGFLCGVSARNLADDEDDRRLAAGRETLP